MKHSACWPNDIFFHELTEKKRQWKLSMCGCYAKWLRALVNVWHFKLPRTLLKLLSFSIKSSSISFNRECGESNKLPVGPAIVVSVQVWELSVPSQNQSTLHQLCFTPLFNSTNFVCFLCLRLLENEKKKNVKV